MTVQAIKADERSESLEKFHVNMKAKSHVNMQHLFLMIRSKAETHVKPHDTCKAQEET